MTENSYRFIAAIGVALVGHAIYWFVGGRSVGASDFRVAAVIVQAIVGVAIVLWSWIARRKSVAASR